MVRTHAGGKESRLNKHIGWYAVLFAACVASRLASTIYYIEDTDSLRFALSVTDAYDVVALQPHFPGYPAFWLVAKALYLATERFAVAFSLIGGIAIFVVIYYALHILALVAPDEQERDPLLRPAGGVLAGLIFFNPLMWLMGNRYMPDLMGLAGALAAFYYLAVTLQKGREAHRMAAVGLLLTGLLAGLRLSYLPLLLPPVLLVLARKKHRLRLVGWGAAGVVVWLIPMVLDTGWPELLAVARRQTVGHFTEFGGTIQTDPQLGRRLTGFLEGLWADGLGGYWTGRHPITGLVGLGFLGVFGVGARRVVRARDAQFLWTLIGLTWVVYAVWIGLYQNVIYKSRHVLPLLPFVLLVAALGADTLLRRRRYIYRVAVSLFLASCVVVTGVLIVQHRQPSAVAQAEMYIQTYADRHEEPLYVVSIPLVNDYLAAHKIEARFLSVESPADRRQARRAAGTAPLIVVGTYPQLLQAAPDQRHVFYHNPYVNRMWSEIEVQVYNGK